MARYKQIFTPYKCFPVELREYLGLGFIKNMLLRNGDFIEDRFGQAQRNSLAESCADVDMTVKIFHWFGSYLFWVDPVGSDEVQRRKENCFVMHMRGRHYDPESDLLKRQSACSTLQMIVPEDARLKPHALFEKVSSEQDGDGEGVILGIFNDDC